MQNLPDLQVKAEQYVSNIVTDIILSIITCGIYALFWQARQIRALNYLLGVEKYNFLKWLLLSIITFGIYNFYHEYLMAQSINELQQKFGKPISAGLPVLSVVLTFFGWGIVTDAIQQSEINKIFGR